MNFSVVVDENILAACLLNFMSRINNVRLIANIICHFYPS